MSKYIPVIGLEIHVQLKTKSKMFSRCSADWFGKEPNTVVDPVTLGLPGALPVPNKKAVEQAILVGMALNCDIAKVSKFDRKHYFYPDLPKGYQISQYDQPLAKQGKFEIRNSPALSEAEGKFEIEKTIEIKRVHLEEDTGKLIHEGSDTLVDFNRAGVPLLEIVTEPDFDSSDTVKYFLEELQVLMRHLGVSDADMEKGSMRLEPNISLREVTSNKKQETNSDNLPKYKVEIKNINSFRFAKAAIDYELARHQELLEKGETPEQETRGWDSVHKRTVSQRTKEGEADYRYFPEPDIPPMEFSDEDLKKIKESMPELPQDRLNRFVSQYGIKHSDAFTITRNLKLADYYEAVCNLIENKQFVASVIVNKKLSTDHSAEEFAKAVIIMAKPKETDVDMLEQAIDQVFSQNSSAIADFKSGKENAMQFLVGQVMRELKGQADANQVKEAIMKRLESEK